MKKSVGLYTEIVVTIALLLVAALLFTGFLLVGLTEKELVDQRVNSVVDMTEVLSRTFFSGYPIPLSDHVTLRSRADSLSDAFISVSILRRWGLVDHELSPQPLMNAESGYDLDLAELSQVRSSGETSVRILFPSTWNPFDKEPQAYVRVIAAIKHKGKFMGALQGQFSLADVRLRIASAQRLVFLYTLLYGGLLLLFGAYILNRTIAKPIRRLNKITGQVAGGDLGQQLPVSGPKEVAEVANSFNQMLVALKESKRETEEHIDSLKQTNDELCSTRDELIRTEKMASVGHLAAGMAHEVGNPLGATIGYLELLKTELAPGRSRELVIHALKETGRIDRLVRDLLDYAVPSSDIPENLDLVEVAKESCDLLTQQGVFRELSCRVDLPDELIGTTIVRHKLQQVLINLLLNARDATPVGGDICLSGGESKDRIWLRIEDTGHGINPVIQEHLFDPFFTTKDPGEGRGLGLSVCHRVIEEAGGSVEVVSEEGKGSSFTIWLPKTEWLR